MWSEYITPANQEEALDLLHKKGDRARIVAGATDLVLEIERGARKGVETLIDVSRIPGLDDITYKDGMIHLGPMVTHNHCVSSKMINEFAFPLARACWEVGSPQIRNRGTVVGNLVTGSPANDTITPLMALGAIITLESIDGKREVPLSEYYIGVRKTVMQQDEMVVDVAFPALKGNSRGIFYKFALRQAQAISVVNTAIVVTMQDDIVSEARITLGAVAPKVVEAVQAGAFLPGKTLDEENINKAADLAVLAARPISDIRGSADYRRKMVQVLVRRGLKSLQNGEVPNRLPGKPVLLWGKSKPNTPVITKQVFHNRSNTIDTRINGKAYSFANASNKTLLRLLREDAGLMGSKEGCAEGECGACTVFLDGVAVMSCIVPAPRAHGAEIITIEGLSQDGKLNPVQSAFIHFGAVQCGYCTPGVIMSASKLLEEKPHPDREEIKQAITGNLCRCTGYYQIIEAIEKAAEMRGE